MDMRMTRHRNKLHDSCLATAPGRSFGELGFRRRSRVQRRGPLVVRGRLHELRRRARPRLPSAERAPISTTARIWLAAISFGAALKALADNALSSSSFHHSGLATSAHTFRVSMLKAIAVALAHVSEPTG
eukprot:scaffold101467_cov55-Phaeocystis_antarctica.AAC.1